MEKESKEGGGEGEGWQERATSSGQRAMSSEQWAVGSGGPGSGQLAGGRRQERGGGDGSGGGGGGGGGGGSGGSGGSGGGGGGGTDGG